MGEPRISVVTPSYNQSAFLEDNLDSVHNQVYENVEHHVVDGGSDDGTVDILDRYEEEYDLRWTSEPDGGQSDAINKGFDRANGDIIGWLNSDDVYFDTTTFSRVAAHFRRTGADVIFGDLAVVDADSVVTGLDVRPSFDYRQLLVRTLVGQPAAFFRAEVLADERLDTDLEFTMDYEFWLRLAREHEFRHVPDLLAGFRRHEAQKTAERAAMRREARAVAAEYRSRSNLASPPRTRLALSELRRAYRTFNVAYRLHRDPPALAFDGRIAGLWRLLRSVGPSVEDLEKTRERWG